MWSAIGAKFRRAPVAQAVANNPLGAEPAYPKQKGCVFDLVPLAHEHGFYWGGHFASRRDGMHFEIAEVR